MNAGVDHNYFRYVQDSYPPLLETLAVKKDDNSWGISSEGRTVSWMRNVQTAVMDIFSNVLGVAALILGALVGVTRAIVSRDSQVVEKAASQASEYGCLAGLHIGAIAGSAISSILVPPASGLANLFYKLGAKATPAPRQDVYLPREDHDRPDIEGVPRQTPRIQPAEANKGNAAST